MYKVFINDQEVGFYATHDAEHCDATYDFQGIKSFPALVESLAIDPVNKKTCIKSDNPQNSFDQFISSFPLIEAAGGVVEHSKRPGELLLIFRLGKWDLPKGKIDAGETPEIAAIREVEEECSISGLEIIDELPATFHMYQLKGKWVMKKTYWFSMICKGHHHPKPQQNENITKAGWYSIAEIEDLLPESYASIRSLLNYYLFSH